MFSPGVSNGYGIICNRRLSGFQRSISILIEIGWRSLAPPVLDSNAPLEHEGLDLFQEVWNVFMRHLRHILGFLKHLGLLKNSLTYHPIIITHFCTMFYQVQTSTQSWDGWTPNHFLIFLVKMKVVVSCCFCCMVSGGCPWYSPGSRFLMHQMHHLPRPAREPSSRTARLSQKGRRKGRNTKTPGICWESRRNRG